jgi:copper oxidase (laccase) domain-containing protein
MATAFGTEPADLRAAIGPSVGPEDYEVGPEVEDAVRAAFPDAWPRLLRAEPGARPKLDLWAANRVALASAGVPPAAISIAGLSTARATDRFYSVRGEGPTTGRFMAGIWLS